MELRISGIAKEVAALGLAEKVEENADAIPERFHSTLGVFAQERFELGKGLLDRIEVRAVGRQIAQFCARGLDGGADRNALVRTEIVHHNDVAGCERGDQHLFDIGQERGRVHWSVHHHRRGQRIASQPCHESGDFPMAVRCTATYPSTFQRTPTQARHIGRASGFIDEHKLFRIKSGLRLAPGLTRFLHVSPQLLFGQHAFF